jgi:hypothetical protein
LRVRFASLLVAFVLAEARAVRNANAQTGESAPAAAAPASVAAPNEASPSAPREITVHGVRRSRDAAETTISVAQGRQVAGTQGDPVKVIESLPGLARSSFGGDQLILWGASPEESRILVDGVEIPRLFHGSGIRSTVNGDFLQSVTLTPGAYGVEFGRATGGLVRLETRSIPGDRAHASVEASTLDGSVSASAPLGEQLRVSLGARYGWLDKTLSAVDAPDVGAYFAVPKYADYQGKATLDLREREAVDLVVLGSTDELTQHVPAPDPSRERYHATKNDFERVYLHYRRTADDGSTVDVVPWIGWDLDRSDAHFGLNPAELEQKSFRLGLRAAHRSPLWTGATLTLGLDAASDSATLARAGSLTIPPREGDVVVFGEPPGDDTNSDDWHTTIVDVAPYANLDFDLGPVNVSPGLRFDGYVIEASRQTPRVGRTPSIGRSAFSGVLEPRVAVRWHLSRRLTLLGAAGLYSQPPAPADLSSVFGTPTLGFESATHASLGESAELTSTLSLTTLGFFRALSDLTVRDPAPTPKLAHALLQNGVGRSYGVQILVRQRPWHGFSGWLAYTVSRSERRDTQSASYRLFDFDEPNLLTLVLSQTAGRWTFGTRFRYASGAPRTPVVGALFDEKDNVYEPVFGAHNGERLPDFWQLDARIDRAFPLGETGRLSLYVEVLNVLNHANGEEYVYSSDYSKRGLVTGLPVLGIFGARLEL